MPFSPTIFDLLRNPDENVRPSHVNVQIFMTDEEWYRCMYKPPRKCSLYSSRHAFFYPSLLQTWRSLLMIWMAVREYEASWHSLLEEGICALLPKSLHKEIAPMGEQNRNMPQGEMEGGQDLYITFFCVDSKSSKRLVVQSGEVP